MSANKGHNARIWIDDAGPFAAKECEVNIDVSLLEIAHKDINPGATGVTSKKRIPDGISASFTVAGIQYSTGSNVKALVDKMIAGTQIAVEYTTDVSGAHVVSFNGYIKSYNSKGNEGDLENYSFSGDSDGDITSGTVV